MLVELRLKNFRCFNDHAIRIRPTTLIVGVNNAGKSTTIEALRIISAIVNRYRSLNFRDVPPWLDAPRIYRGVSPSLRGIDFNALSIFHRLGDAPATIHATFDNGATIEAFIGPEAEIHAVIRESDGTIVTSKAKALRAEIAELSILPQVGPLLREEFILDRDYARRITSSNWSSIHFRNQLYLYPEYFDDFKELSETTWPGLRILELEHENSMQHNKLALLVQDDEFVAEIAWMGHGLQIWLQTMWFLARSKGSESVILDEPDVYMHADLQRKLIRLLLRRHRQVIAATHSVEIMAEVEASDVLIINRTQSVSNFADSIPAVQKLIDSIGGVHNLQLARLWNSRKCISVEGKDVSFLRQLQSVLFPKTTESFDTLPNIRLGGWNNWSYATGTKLLLKNSFDGDVSVYCILDSDYHLLDEIQETYKQAKNRGIELHIWKKKEIENYFVVPEAILRIICREIRRQVQKPSIDQIRAVIDAVAEAHKTNVFDAVATAVHLRNRSGGHTDANVVARAKIESQWTDRDQRWAMVSGKALISGLSSWSQETFGVSLSPMKILRELTRSEIDPEMRVVIAAIERGAPFPEDH